MHREKILNDYLLLTSKRARQIFEKCLSDQQIINLREDIIAKFKSINEFETKYIFWHTHAGLMTYLSRKEEEKLNELQADLYEDREGKGLIEPEATNDIEKEFVVKWHINNNLQSFKDYKILSFEDYKKEFVENIIGKLNLQEFANEELERMNTYIDSVLISRTLVPVNITAPIRYTKKIVFSDLIYQMTNNNYQVDYSTLYAYIQSKYFNYHDLSLILTPILYKRYLKVQIDETLSKEKSISKKPKATIKEYKFGYDKDKLVKIYRELLKANFLNEITNEKDFINAFSDEVLNEDFKQIIWQSSTIGAICFHFIMRGKPKWEQLEKVSGNANYRKLLSQSRNTGTYKWVVEKLQKTIL